jgi:hypothetical protein
MVLFMHGAFNAQQWNKEDGTKQVAGFDNSKLKWSVIKYPIIIALWLFMFSI